MRAAARCLLPGCKEQRLLAQRGTKEVIASTNSLSWCPPDLASAPMLQEFPQLALRLIATNEPVDLISERIDLAFRLGPAEDSSQVAQSGGAALCAVRQPGLSGADGPSGGAGGSLSTSDADPDEPRQSHLLSLHP